MIATPEPNPPHPKEERTMDALLISDEEIAATLARGEARRARQAKEGITEAVQWPKREDFYGGKAKTSKVTAPANPSSDYYYPDEIATDGAVQDEIPYLSTGGA